MHLSSGNGSRNLWKVRNIDKLSTLFSAVLILCQSSYRTVLYRVPVRGSYLKGGAANTTHGIPSQNSNTLPSSTHLSHKDRSPGRTSSQYLSPYPRTWQPSKKSLSPKRYSTGEHSQQHSTDRSSRFMDYHSPSSYGWAKDMRRSLSPCYGDYSYLHGRDRSPGHRSQKPRAFLPSRNTVWTDLSLRFPKTLRYSGKMGDTYRRSDATYSGTYDRPRISDLSGWRAKLAQQGYVASTSKKVRRPCLPERKWQYLDDHEVEEEEDGFEFRTSCGTHPESGEQLYESVISRTKRMKLQKCTESPTVVEIAVQVDPEDLQKYKEQEERRVNRSFISSRHHSWYDPAPISYRKYLSPMPWRGSGNYSSTRSSRSDNEEIKEASPAPEQTETNKDFRKSALNVDLPHTEAQLFAQRQAETRWRRTVEDNYYTSEEGSPSETGYDSSYTDADRSSGDTEGFFTDSLDRSYTFGTSYRSSQRSTPFGDDGHFLDGAPGADGPFEELDPQQIRLLAEQFVDSTDLNSDLDTEGCSDAVPHGDIIAENLCFRFKSLNEESSQRDSGFSEIYNQSDSPGNNTSPDQDTDQKYDESSKEVFISGCYDIDQLLTDKYLDYTAFQTFEDFDRLIERHKSNVRRRLSCEEELTYCKPRWSKPAKAGLKLDMEACSKFIGTCHDIDEMLGVPTPLSPDSEASLAQEKIMGDTIPDEEEGDGVSTAATSIIGCSDIADLTWISDHDSVIEQDGLKKIQGWPTSPRQGNWVSVSACSVFFLFRSFYMCFCNWRQIIPDFLILKLFQVLMLGVLKLDAQKLCI
ncbi:uncharacterized protein NPIL_631251 [Nephila pilipes]|uniref:Uncharacterized protein n=1 Tax=Nephila pilipes TaxID=299642 RepID=A0A8X6QSH3_NEPPI|nr:uncharacterized protein NPIL_631251 [Nephila pilipes]